MLRLGFDPAAPGVDGGTALHAACWVGSVRMVERLLARGGVPLDARDPTQRARRSAGPHSDRSIAAPGAQTTRPSPSGSWPPALTSQWPGTAPAGHLLEMAHGNPAMQDALRRLGAT